MAQDKTLYRSGSPVIGGVCGGIAEYFGIEPVVVRLLAVLLAIGTLSLTIFAYLILILVIPKAPTAGSPAPGQAGSPVYEAPGFEQSPETKGQCPSTGARAVVVLGLLLLGFGIMGLLGLFARNVSWWQFWPVLLIVLGLGCMLFPGPCGLNGKRVCVGIVIAALGAFALNFTLGLLQWATVEAIFSHLWPALFIAAGLVLIGSASGNRVFSIMGVVCLILFMLAGLLLYAIPADGGLSLSVPLAGDAHVLIQPWKA